MTTQLETKLAPVEFVTSEEFDPVGKSVARKDVVPKVTGRAVYAGDLSMPGMGGLDLAKRVLDTHPGTPIVLASGFATEPDADQLRELGIRSLLPKPFNSEQLGLAIHRALVHTLSP